MVFRSARQALVTLLGVWLVSVGDVAALTAREALESLKSPDAAARFDAAWLLLGVTSPRLDAALTHALESDFFEGFPEGRAAAEFVRLERSGKRTRWSGETPARPNLLVVSIDTLRADRLGCYGYDSETSPTIDALANSGALFLEALSPSSWTLPAHMSLFTSLYPSFHKLEKGGRLGSVRLDASERTMAESFRAAGYATAAFVAHPFLGAEWGFDRGFDLYRRYSTGAELQGRRAQAWLSWHAFHVARGLAAPSFFLFLHFIDPHEPYQAPEPYRSRFFPDYAGSLRPDDKMVTLFRDRDFESPEDFRYAKALYDGEVRYVDSQLAGVLARLEELGWRQSTAILLTSDHGEEFKDHGSMGHKATLYAEQLRVPLLLALPGRIAAGQRVESRVSLVDVAPTLLELAGLPPMAAAQGRSVLPLLAAPGRPPATQALPARDVFAELGPADVEWEQDFYRRAITSGGYKLIESHNKDGTVRRELYATVEDPGDQRDLYASLKDSEAIQGMESRLRAFLQTGLRYAPGSRSRNEIPIDDETRERLRALGYMD